MTARTSQPMLELRCPTCRATNEVREHAPLDRVRCARCEGALDDDRKVRYFVATPQRVLGPEVRHELEERIELRMIGPDTWISEEGGPWFRAAEREDLFARLRRPAPRRRSPAPLEHRRRASHVPGTVMAMAVIDIVAAALVLLLAIVALAFGAGSLGAMVLLPVLILVFLGLGLLSLSNALRRGSLAARNLQLALALVSGLLILMIGTPGSTLVALVFMALPAVLLMSAEARVFFEAS